MLPSRSVAFILLLFCYSFFVGALAFSTTRTTTTSLFAMSSSATATTATTTATNAKRILYDVPVSNNGARCRIILYKKEIPEPEVKITSPMDVGGLKSDVYTAMNPQQKMPCLVCTSDETTSSDGSTMLNLAESDTISRYLLHTFSQIGPSFQPDNAKSNLICRIHDMYLTTIQGCMYKPGPPFFGPFWTRKDALAEYQKQLQVINDMIVMDDNDGMYMCGNEVSLADATVFPSCVFARHLLPKFDIDPPLPEKLETWFNKVKDNDPVFSKVYEEIMSGLRSWDDNKRFDPILGAGWRDDAPATIFDKILAGDIPAAIVRQDDKILAFKDINPAAPAHVLVIPKDRNGLTRLSKATSEHYEILGRLLVAAAEISTDASLGFGDGARIVINDGNDGGQEVMHLHVHVLGGRQLQWPPG